jgi:hypothetical protein
MNTLAHDTEAGEITLSTTLYDILNGEPLTVTPRLSTDAAGASGLVSSWRLQSA